MRLRRHARTLMALADQWSAASASAQPAFSPYEGSEDLNSLTAVQLDGVLFMEGENCPAEITGLIRDLRATAADTRATGEWLATAMQASWDMATALTGIDGLADMLRRTPPHHRQRLASRCHEHLISRILDRTADILDQVDFTPAALRADLADGNASTGRLHSAAELISHAAGLASDSAGLVHDNERRWRAFRQRVAQLTQA